MKISATVSLDAPMTDPVLFRGQMDKILPVVAKLGFDGVELHVSDPVAQDMKKIIQQCKRNHLTISTLATGSNVSQYNYSLSSPQESVRKSTIQCMKRYIDIAGEVESMVIVGLLKGFVRDSSSYNAFEIALTDSLQECLCYASARGVTLVLEAINRYESDTMNTIHSILAYLKKLNSPNLLLHVDTFHMNIEESDPLKNLLDAKGKIGHVHYVDNNCGWPGNGTIPFHQVTTVLESTGYNGFYAVECLPIPGEYMAAKKAITYLRSIPTAY